MRKLFTAFVFLALASCHSTKPDQFFNAIVDCAQVNPATSAALAQVETCLSSTLTGNVSSCLTGLTTELHFTVDEITCVVAYIAQRENTKVAASTAAGPDLQKRNAAAAWLTRENIAIRNSYSRQ